MGRTCKEKGSQKTQTNDGGTTGCSCRTTCDCKGKRLRENPPKYKNVHPSVLAKPDDHTFSLKNVRQWIKTQKELLKKHRSDARMKQPVKGSIAKAASTEGYIRHCEAYLANGDWIDDFYGEYQEGRVRWVTIAG